MKKFLLLLIIAICLTGCGNKLKEEANIELEKGDVTSICKKKEKVNDDITAITTTTSNYDSNNDIINMKIETSIVFNEKNTFDTYLTEAKATSESISSDDIEFKYAYDEKKKEIFTVIAYKKFSLISEIKPVYSASTHIKTLESNGEKCEVIGKTRLELGI